MKLGEMRLATAARRHGYVKPENETPVAFGREYVLRSFKWIAREEMTAQINAAIAEYDHPRAAASIACMSNDADELHILIEQWRDGRE